MSGALLQLAAIGPQNQSLTINPQITFFQFKSQRHSNFAIESIEHLGVGQVTFGQKINFPLHRSGDLVSKMYFEFVLPKITATDEGVDGGVDGGVEFSWVPNIGEFLIKEVQLVIDGKVIDTHYGEWLNIWSELTIPKGHKSGYKRLIGNIPQLVCRQKTLEETSVMVPLQFWFCRNYGVALPIVAMEHSEVRINITIQDIDKLLLKWEENTPGTPGTYTVNWATNGYRRLDPISKYKAKLWVDYIFLDNDERRKFVMETHDYVIEQLQSNGDITIGTTGLPNAFNPNTVFKKSFTLNFRHPVKELFWVCKTNRYNPGDYTFRTKSANGQIPLLGGVPPTGAHPAGAHPTMEAIYSPERLLHEHFNPIKSALLILNGQERFKERTSSYFENAQPLQHHTNIPTLPGINMYSFALKPEEVQPSGSFNFSKIKNPLLGLTFATTTKDGFTYFKEYTPIVNIYALNYNQLRIKSGVAALAFNS